MIINFFLRMLKRRLSRIVYGSGLGVVRHKFLNDSDAHWARVNLMLISLKYGKATIADYHNFIKVPNKPGDYSYGWSRGLLFKARVVRCGGGKYTIKFPKPIKL